MKAAALKYTVLSLAATLASFIIVLVPYHAFLTVWLSSIFGYYTAFRLWKEALLLVIALAVFYLLLTDKKIRSHTLTRRLVWLVIAYALLHVAAGFIALENDSVTLKAVLYGGLVNLRFLVFFLLVWAIALRTSRLQNNWRRLLIWPAIGVIIFGLMQIFILPANFLTNFGYGPTTINAVSTVNSNQEYIRISSTLRGPNPLGAYLIIPCTAIFVLILKAGRKWRLAAMLIGGLVVLAASFSRSGALGMLVSLSLAFVLMARTRQAKKYLAYSAAGLVVLSALLVLAIPSSSKLENVILHTDSESAIASSSNDERLEAIQFGIADVVKDPLGEGPGTAGPASVYNDNKVQIAENYFLQVGQEVGILGLLLFVLINAGLAYLLWLRRAEPLALILFTSLIGLTLVNMLSHAWADDTLAYLWWGLAGIAMASLPTEHPESETS